MEGSGNLILMCVFFGLEGKVETPTLPRQLGIPVHVLLGCLRIMVKAVIVLFLLSFLSILQVFSMLRPTFYCFCMFFFFKARWALVEERACMWGLMEEEELYRDEELGGCARVVLWFMICVLFVSLCFLVKVPSVAESLRVTFFLVINEAWLGTILWVFSCITIISIDVIVIDSFSAFFYIYFKKYF